MRTYPIPLIVSAVLLSLGITQQVHANGGIQIEVEPPPVPAYNSNTDAIKGPKRAPVMLIEYSDYECPFCKRHHPVMTQLIKQNRNRVSWVYRHYPLASIHPQALKAAQAADCALRQGGNNAFWRYSDALFKEESLDETDFTRIARTQKLKVPAFTRCIENPDLATAMEALAHNAHEMGISGTPTTIVVNRRTGDQTRVPGAVPIETLQKAIDDILNAK